MSSNRFGASKYRNAVPHISPRDEWYRSLLPAASTSTSSATSTFSSEIKANREYIVTVTPAGDISWRKYRLEGSDDQVRSSKLGAGVLGDWDLSRLEGGALAVGGNDGALHLYRLSPDKCEEASSSSSTGSAVNLVSLHPTTPSIALCSTIKDPVTIWDLSSSPSSPAIHLESKEPKGFWSLAWSPDGLQVAGVGKSGTAYVWNPRTSRAPLTTRLLPLQPLKPVRLAWVGEDILVTSTSKTRNREYHLFSTSKSLATIFTQSIDNNTAPLIPVLDQERKIAYLAGKGDMTLRQVEFTGPMGFQETLHPLPHPLSSASLALASPTMLPVMQAQIATLLVPVVDKDGDAILPFGIKVPRRQLIDFHDDLYPDIQGFTSEQSAKDWFAGSDKFPLPISLDPSRRGIWEKELASRKPSPRASTIPVVQSVKEPEPFAAAVSATKDKSSGPATSTSTPSNSEPSPPASHTPVHTAQPPKPVNPDLPDLEGDDTYSSTLYKARIIAGHIGAELDAQGSGKGKRPMFVGLQGPQGCGKTTLCDGFVAYLQDKMGIKAAVLSLDDLYHTHSNLKALAAKHPNNHLLSGRGPSGTHDIALAVATLAAIEKINESPSATVDLPVFDKSLQGGEGDRSKETVKVEGPIDVFILEGWSMGFSPLSPDKLKQRYSTFTAPEPYFASHSLEALVELNSYLTELAKAIYPFFSTLITVAPTSYEFVFAWRLQQEHAMKAKNGGNGMTDQQVRAFVERYMPGYELWRDGIWDQGWSGLELEYGKDREVLSVKRVGAKHKERSMTVENQVSPQSSSTPAPDSTGPTKQVATGTPPSITGNPEETTSTSTPSKSAPPPPPSQTSKSTIQPTSKAQPVHPAPAATTPSKPFNPTYSRKFLGGKSPLIPSYDAVPSLSTLHPDSIVLKCSTHLALFPIQGTGGRLCVHPLSRKGRMTLGGEGYLSNGVEIANFAVETFVGDGNTTRVAVAGEDGAIRVWRVGALGISGAAPEAESTLKGKGIDKIAQIVFHPTARDLLVAVTNDHGTSSLRFFDLSSGTESKVVPLDAKGIYNFSIQPDGSRFALASKDGQVVVLDPRKPQSAVKGKAHDSSRSFQLEWVDSEHLISVGFNRGSQRRINLYSISATQVETKSSLLVDISPSVLFAHYDPDTRIMYVWGKGERVISAYEINPDASEPIAKLPSYTAGEAQLGVAFLPKKAVDVEKIEVMKALRITAKAMEEVSFSIPRNKPEFFQDDIYVNTIDVENSSTTAQEWLQGDDSPPKYISLKPDGMTFLSEAPKTTSVAKAKFVPAKDVMTEEQKKKQEMDALFARAKADESSEDEAPVQKGLPPPDDDW